MWALTIPTVHDVVFVVVVLAAVGLLWSILRPSVAENFQRPLFTAVVIVVFGWLCWYFGAFRVF